MNHDFTKRLQRIEGLKGAGDDRPKVFWLVGVERDESGEFRQHSRMGPNRVAGN